MGAKPREGDPPNVHTWTRPRGVRAEAVRQLAQDIEALWQKLQGKAQALEGRNEHEYNKFWCFHEFFGDGRRKSCCLPEV